MTILQSLDRYYDRMARRGEATAAGWSNEPVGTVVVLSTDGAVVDVHTRLDEKGKRGLPMLVPKPFNRQGTGSTPYFLWDNTAYALGVSAREAGKTARDHAAWRKLHFDLLRNASDEGLLAVRSFLERWRPEMFVAPFETRMTAWNLVFQLEGERKYIHDRPKIRSLIDEFLSKYETEGLADHLNQCLVTGSIARPRTLHTKIKGIPGTSNPEVPFVSFNQEAFESYGKKQAENAPVCSASVARYTASLTALLDSDRTPTNRLNRRIGDATIVFWADTSETIDETAATAVEDLFFEAVEATEPKDDDRQEAVKLRDALEAVAEGRPRDVSPVIRSGTRFHVLGLAPNAARLSVRYWLDDAFEAFAQRLVDHQRDLSIDPLPRGWSHKTPSVSRLLVKTTALAEKFENIPPLLAGEVMRAILSGTRYPRSWLSAAMMRLRAGDDASAGWHAAVIRAVLERDRRLKDIAKRGKEVPVSLARESTDEAYQLGRLFAVLETAQRLALGKINATIRDRYFGAASATPASVFPILLRNLQNHIGKLRKERKDIWIEREIGEIVDRLPEALPRTLKLEAQGRFVIGFYHQRQAQFAKHAAETPNLQDNEEREDDDNDNG